jgi:hypothetical protein
MPWLTKETGDMGRRVRAGAAGMVTALLVAAWPAAAYADTLGDWQLDEQTGSTTAVDSSGNGRVGQIGSDVVLHEATPTGFGYRFKGDWRIVNKNRLVTWPDDAANPQNAALDPGTGTYAVTLRVKTGALDPNIAQKGQNNQVGGYWKFVLKKGWPRCHFEDSTGKILAIGFVNDIRPEVWVSDNEWHTLRCEKTATGVKATVDYGEPGAISKFKRGTLGVIDNKQPMMLGGKLFCDGGETTCDYFAGAIDWFRIDR